jgi:outer membrane immunogenic protein
MKKIFLTTASIFVLAGVATAADLATKKGPPAAPAAPMWTGFYAGLNLGGGWGANSGYSSVWNTDIVNGGYTNFYSPNNISGGILGGGQVGYNHQLSSLFVVGAEADIQGSTMGSGGNGNQYAALVNINSNVVKTVIGPAGGNKSIPWFGTVRGRIGVTPIQSVFLYGTAGFAYASVQYNSGYQQSTTQVGWTAGGGAEWMFMPNWSAKAEYLYANVSGQNSNPWGNTGTQLTNINNNTRWNTVRAGVNYHFNFDNGLPAIAKY